MRGTKSLTIICQMSELNEDSAPGFNQIKRTSEGQIY